MTDTLEGPLSSRDTPTHAPAIRHLSDTFRCPAESEWQSSLNTDELRPQVKIRLSLTLAAFETQAVISLSDCYHNPGASSSKATVVTGKPATHKNQVPGPKLHLRLNSLPFIRTMDPSLAAFPVPDFTNL